MSKPSVRRSRSGFTLTEVLVAVAMVGVLAAVVIPTVINQVSKGEISRIVQDVQNINTGVQLFRADVGRFPTTLNQLAAEPTSVAQVWTTSGSGPTQITDAQIASWDGPYIEKFVAAGDSLETGFGAAVHYELAVEDWGGSNFMKLAVYPISQVEAEAISLVVDGEILLSPSDDGHGRVRWVDATVDTLWYIGGPIK